MQPAPNRHGLLQTQPGSDLCPTTLDGHFGALFAGIHVHKATIPQQAQHPGWTGAEDGQQIADEVMGQHDFVAGRHEVVLQTLRQRLEFRIRKLSAEAIFQDLEHILAQRA